MTAPELPGRGHGQSSSRPWPRYAGGRRSARPAQNPSRNPSSRSRHLRRGWERLYAVLQLTSGRPRHGQVQLETLQALAPQAPPTPEAGPAHTRGRPRPGRPLGLCSLLAHLAVLRPPSSLVLTPWCEFWAPPQGVGVTTFISQDGVSQEPREGEPTSRRGSPTGRWLTRTVSPGRNKKQAVKTRIS